MKIAHFTSQDTGGQAARLARALREIGHDAHAFRTCDDYMRWPCDVEHPHVPDWVADFLASVDVVHVHNMYRRANGWGTINPSARWVIHQHGRMNRALIAETLEADAARGALRIVSTLNLLEYVDGDVSRWLPTPIFLEDYDAIERETSDDFVIAHSPTNREYKRTDMLLETVESLRRDGYAIRLELIENVTHDECVRRRAASDCSFDQMHLCYGSSSLEAWAFSTPSLVGCPDETRDRVRGVCGDEPYVYVDETSLASVIATLASDEELCRSRGRAGREHLERFHEARRVARLLVDMYER